MDRKQGTRRFGWLLDGEEGDSLPFALIVLAIGTLLVGMLLFRTSSSLRILETFDTTLRSQYSSDSGVEFALWRIAHDGPLRQTLITNPGIPQYIDVPIAVNAITPTVQAVCVVTAAAGYAGVSECADPPEGACPNCADLTPDVYVQDGLIVGGPDDGEPYAGVLRGTKDDDIIMGTDGADEIWGYKGDDIICGLGGNDLLYGGDRDDVLCGGEGDDRLYGENHADVLCGGRGDDLLDGGKQVDVLCGGQGNDQLYGDKGNDGLDGGVGADLLVGGGGTDNCCNGELEGCESQDCEPTGAIHAVFDIQSTAQDITTTVRISETIDGGMVVLAWHLGGG